MVLGVITVSIWLTVVLVGQRDLLVLVVQIGSWSDRRVQHRQTTTVILSTWVKQVVLLVLTVLRVLMEETVVQQVITVDVA